MLPMSRVRTHVVTGADERSRTPDLRITNALLYQLSYIGLERNSSRIHIGRDCRPACAKIYAIDIALYKKDYAAANAVP